MRRQFRKRHFYEPSLVPLADMLTNTVGIMIFILIFTVLTAGGAMIYKRLPIEHETDLKKASYYICTDGQIYPLRHELVDKLFDSLGKPERSKKGFEEFSKKSNGSQMSDEFMRIILSVTVEQDFNTIRLRYGLTCIPIPKAGIQNSELVKKNTFYAHDLEILKPEETAMIYCVKPNGIEIFHAAREFALKKGFSANWRAIPESDQITFTFGGGSGKIIAQ